MNQILDLQMLDAEERTEGLSILCDASVLCNASNLSLLAC
ncbi:SapB/AmfS family lanthipeptide [Kineosporia babensis]